MENSNGVTNMIDTRFERKAFFNASLKLIKEGRFQSSPLAEIAFIARISESTVPYVFESRDRLVIDLGTEIINEIDIAVTEAIRLAASFRDKFHGAWRSLFDYYFSHPSKIVFIEQFDVLLGSNDKNRPVYPGLSATLLKLFESAEPGLLTNRLSPLALACFFHDNAIISAKMHLHHPSLLQKSQIDEMIYILWCSMLEDKTSE